MPCDGAQADEQGRAAPGLVAQPLPPRPTLTQIPPNPPCSQPGPPHVPPLPPHAHAGKLTFMLSPVLLMDAADQSFRRYLAAQSVVQVGAGAAQRPCTAASQLLVRAARCPALVSPLEGAVQPSSGAAQLPCACAPAACAPLAGCPSWDHSQGPRLGEWPAAAHCCAPPTFEDIKTIAPPPSPLPLAPRCPCW
jgi:hypothetical protein